MKHIIKIEKFIKQIDTEVEIDLPTETIYLFETGIRRSVKIIPKYTTWLKERYNKEDEEIWKYEFVCVYNNFESKIHRETIQVSEFDRLYSSKEPSIKKKLLELLICDIGLKRTQQEFEADFNECLRKLQE